MSFTSKMNCHEFGNFLIYFYTFLSTVNDFRKCQLTLFCFMPQVKKVIVQEGFERQKRGYRDINDFDVGLNDPLFTKQWYLVSETYVIANVIFLMPSCLTFSTVAVCGG